MNLDILQVRFRDAVIGDDDAIVAAIAGGGTIDARRRLSIYRDAYRLRLLEVLRDNYPGLLAMLGDEAFDAIGREYIDRHPSPYRSIRWYGDRLADFLATAQRYADRPWLADMARLDWAMAAAFDAADAEPATVQHLATIAAEAWPGMTIRLHPSVIRLELRWQVAPWRGANAGEAPAGTPAASDHPVPWLVWRKELRQFFRSLDVDEAFAIDAVRGGADFATVCGGLCEWLDERHAPARAAAMLKRWLVDHLVAGIELKAARGPAS